MTRQEEKFQIIELAHELPNPGVVAFDSLKASLEGAYGDELSAYRARKVWTNVLETNFLLEKGHDFKLRVSPDESSESSFRLTCDFVSACGRYALWRLTHDQAPEAQYLIETAHIPPGEYNLESMLFAPDMKRRDPEAALMRLEEAIAEGAESAGILHRLSRKVLNMLGKSGEQSKPLGTPSTDE